MSQTFLYLTTKRYQYEKKAKEAEMKEMAHRKEDALMTIEKAESRRQRKLEMLENKDFSNTTRMSREFYAILGPGDPKILSAMAMVMRISGTLCVLVLAGFLC